MQINTVGATFGGQFDHSLDVILVRVHATGRQQAHDVHGMPAVDRLIDGVGQHLVGKEGAGGDRAVDARVFLVDDPAGTDVEVPDLGIAHLFRGQSDGCLGGIDKGMGILLPEPVPDRFAGRGNGVVLGFLAVAPAIQDQQYQRPRGIRHKLSVE